MQQQRVDSRGRTDEEVHWGAADIVAMCLAMFDTIGPGLLVIAGIMVGLSAIVTIFFR